MTFKTEGGDKANLSVTGIKEDLTSEEVSAAMDVFIIKSGPFIVNYCVRKLQCYLLLIY